MKANSRLRRKRVLLPLLSLMMLAGTVLVAVLRSDTSCIIVYNETGASITALKVTACGQSTVCLNLDEENSFRWKLAQSGDLGEIALETATDPPWRWHGAYVELVPQERRLI